MRVEIILNKKDEERTKLPVGITRTMGVLAVLSFVVSYLFSEVSSHGDYYYIAREIFVAFTGLAFLFSFLFFIFLIVRADENGL